MPRSSRMVVEGESAVYHVISRTALPGYVLGGVENDFLLKLIKRLSSVYFAEVLGFCLMGNHFHLVVRMSTGEAIEGEEINSRFARYHGDDSGRLLLPGQIPTLRNKWSSLSEYVKEIKQGFSRFYNKLHGRKGFFWSDRFKSVIVEEGETLINLLAYVDLNPVRAGLVERPEEYRWNSLGYHQQTNNKDNFLSLDFGLADLKGRKKRERLVAYRRFVYEKGALPDSKGKEIDPEIMEAEKGRAFTPTAIDRFRLRCRYFSDSGIIGSKGFVRRCFSLVDEGGREKIPKLVSGLSGVYSLKRLSEKL